METKQRRAVREQRDQLLTLVNNWDPIGLLGSGAPRNEYDRVIDKLLGMLSRSATRDEIARTLDADFAEHYGAKPKDVEAFVNRAVTWFQLASANE